MSLTAAQAGNKVGVPQYVGNIPKGGEPSLTPKPALASLFKLTLTDPIVGDLDGWVTTFAGPDTATLTKLKAGFNGALGVTGVPDYPRNVVITVTHGSSVVAESGTITGIDLYGTALTEAWSVTAGTTSKTFTGKKAFARVDSVTITTVADGSANSNIIGTGNVFGLPFKCSSVQPIGEMQDGAVPTAGTIVAAGTASTADMRGTYSPNAAPDGSKDYVVYFLSDDPTGSTGANT